MRWLWFALGWVMVGLGVIGALLPVMPTTIFLILAVGCFARSSPKFEQRLLAHPRYAGYVFNPVSFYYCYEADGVTLAAILAEITNTPWKQRHCIVLPADTAERQDESLIWRFDKRFHVSPFMPMDCARNSTPTSPCSAASWPARRWRACCGAFP
ncbi:hypothetical protein G6F65_014523 [Rhizopus arrhizus]|nr:hypothetical protein G6F65_014523 [Rhizopus arrhizus]